MPAAITKEAKFTRISCARLTEITLEDGQRSVSVEPLEDIIFMGSVKNSKKAEALVIEKYGPGKYYIFDPIEERGRYSMSVEDFIRHANKIESESSGEMETDAQNGETTESEDSATEAAAEDTEDTAEDEDATGEGDENDEAEEGAMPLDDDATLL